MHHPHQFHYSESERRQRQDPEQILRAAGLAPGMSFVDIGANDGFFTLPAIDIVGQDARVVAIDTDADALDRLAAKLTARQLANVDLIHRPAEEVVAGHHFADFIFFGIVLHDFYDPLAVLKNAAAMLAADGLIYDFDWRKTRTALGPPLEKRFTRQYVASLADQAGLAVAASIDLDADYYAVTLKHQPGEPPQ